MKNNALTLIIHHLFTECFSWVPYFITCNAETLDSTAPWNDSSAIKMHCQKSWNGSQIPWCKTFKGLYGVPVQMDFSLQSTLILSGSGRRYHFQCCRILLLTANKVIILSVIIWLSPLWVAVGVMGHLYSFFIPCSLWIGSLSLHNFQEQQTPCEGLLCQQRARLLPLLKQMDCSGHSFECRVRRWWVMESRHSGSGPGCMGIKFWMWY